MVQAAPGAVAQALGLVAAGVHGAHGSASAGRLRRFASAATSRSRRVVRIWRPRAQSWATRADSSPTSGTTSLAASVGVDARTSATRSSNGLSCSWPIALTTGVRQAATARRRVSSENGSRSSTDPPPRATTMTSTAGSASSSARAFSHLVDCVRALHGDLAGGELDRGPAPAGVVEDVPFGRARPSANQPDTARQKREGALAASVEQPLGGQDAPQVLEPRQQFADADRADRLGRERHRPAGDVEVRTAEDDDPRAVRDRRDHRVEQAARARDLQAHVRDRVAQGQEHRAGARPPHHLRDLALDPHLAELGDPLPDEVRHRANRDRLLRARLQPHAPERRPRARRSGAGPGRGGRGARLSRRRRRTGAGSSRS